MTRPVGTPEVSAGGALLFRLMYRRSTAVIRGATWRHDFLYKNKGVIEPPPDKAPWLYRDPRGQIWCVASGRYTRADADWIYRHDLRELGFPAFAAITYAVNRMLGWIFWHDLNERFK